MEVHYAVNVNNAFLCKTSKATFKADGIHIWNKAPKEIKEAKTCYVAKIEVKKFVTHLPT